MWRVIFMEDYKAILVDENRATYQLWLPRSEDYKDIIQEAFEKGQEITFADYRNKEIQGGLTHGTQKQLSRLHPAGHLHH